MNKFDILFCNTKELNDSFYNLCEISKTHNFKVFEYNKWFTHYELDFFDEESSIGFMLSRYKPLSLICENHFVIKYIKKENRFVFYIISENEETTLIDIKYTENEKISSFSIKKDGFSSVIASNDDENDTEQLNLFYNIHCIINDFLKLIDEKISKKINEYSFKDDYNIKLALKIFSKK